MYILPGVGEAPADARLAVDRTASHQAVLEAVADDADGAIATPSPAPDAPSRAQGQRRSRQRALSRGAPRDPAARREPDAADAGRHPRPRSPPASLVFAYELGPARRAAARSRSTRSSPAGASSRPSLTAAWAARRCVSAETATLVTSQFLHGGWLHLAGQHAVPVDLREQRRGPPRAAAGSCGFYLVGGVVARR